jgi:glycosyltransferase involved in cell wall biosynthesis
MPGTNPVKNSELRDWVILLPTYNNAGTLADILMELEKQDLDIIAINDGSTDHTGTILSAYRNVKTYTFDKNKGKGMALRYGFEQAYRKGYKTAITLDTDGQHDPADLAQFNTLLKENNEVLILGSRNMKRKDVPRRSSFGRSFSNFWVQVATGYKLSDTQTGFRAYPLEPIHRITWYTNRFEFEIEIMVRLAWQGVPILEVPIAVEYPENRVSHFRPFQDFMRVSLLNTFLVPIGLLYQRPKMWLSKLSVDRLKKTFLNEWRRGESDPVKLSLSIGVGLFFGIAPIWGYQMLAAFGIASIFKLNRILVLLFSNISVPPMIPFILYGSYKIGGFVLSNPDENIMVDDITWELVYTQIAQYTVGALLLALIVGSMGTLLTFLIVLIKNKLSV